MDITEISISLTNIIKVYISELNKQLNIPMDILLEIYFENTAETCKAIIKSGARKNQKCLAKPKQNGFCTRHQKQQEIEYKRPEPLIDEKTKLPMFKKHRGYYVFSDLVIRSLEDKRVTGRIDNEGTIHKLTEDDINFIKKYRLKYIEDDE
jgi:hypothetical protein